MTEKIEIEIWGRHFVLDVEHDPYVGKETIEQQDEALERFLEQKDWIAASKPLVEQYCHDSVMEDDENKKKDNIFSYVMPDYIYIHRDGGSYDICLICNYRYDPEHGIAIVFLPDQKIKVGSQDLL